MSLAPRLHCRFMPTHCSLLRLLALVLALVPAATAVAQASEDPLLVIELWSELDPLVADGGERPVPREVAIERLLDEATLVFSGMIYGFRYRYVPAYVDRGVAEVFELDPYATIVRGDPRLRVRQTWVEADRLYARISYELDPRQQPWYGAWQSAANVRSAGTGSAPFIRGPAAKPDAIRDAVRMAVRNHAREIEWNRPRAIAGAVIVSHPPVTVVRDGSYLTSLAVLLQVDDIERYEVY